MRTEIKPGQDSDYTGYDLVMADNLPQPAVLVADRGYDSDKIREDIESRNALPMIPMRKNRKVRKAVDRTIYTLRNMVERCFNKLKNSRRLATRYDKTAESFLGFVDVACIRLWLRHLSTRPRMVLAVMTILSMTFGKAMAQSLSLTCEGTRAVSLYGAKGLKESLPATPYAVRVDIWGDQWFRTTDGYGGAVIKSRAQYELIYQQEESGSLRTIIDRSTGVYETSGSLPANEDYVVITESGTCRPIIDSPPKF